ncbi:MAG: outer membrane protein assembly factor BamE [Sulfuricellaceae bacterium]|nr:outer membrane protein assembly factor BamE [Sulfuricellaceae bacterium]
MRLFPFILAALLSACSGIPTVHKIDIQQGNVVTQEMVSRLKVGMTRSQVRFVMGTPLVTDAFHPDRWDYIYRYLKADKLVEQRHVTVVFSGDSLSSIESDIPPDTGKAAPDTNNAEIKPQVKPE